jgi:hypothetical protein
MSRNSAAEAQTQEFSTGEDFLQLLQESPTSKVTEGSVVKGEVIAIDEDWITIDVGLKSEGRISAKEFYELGEKPNINIGDQDTDKVQLVGEVVFNQAVPIQVIDTNLTQLDSFPTAAYSSAIYEVQVK